MTKFDNLNPIIKQVQLLSRRRPHNLPPIFRRQQVRLPCALAAFVVGLAVTEYERRFPHAVAREIDILADRRGLRFDLGGRK